jgi:hypothetical protein
LLELKYWEINAENISKAGWSWGCVSAVDCEGETFGSLMHTPTTGKGFVVRAVR